MRIKQWTFISNHGLVLSYISCNGSPTAREIADRLGITERTTQKIISDLVRTGYIQRVKRGQRNVYCVNPELPLRHQNMQDVPVSDLLDALNVQN